VGVTRVRDTCSYPTGNSRAFLSPRVEEKTQDVAQFVSVFTAESLILSLFQWFPSCDRAASVNVDCETYISVDFVLSPQIYPEDGECRGPPKSGRNSP
jgi:hypothetical protein